jgi:two-component system NtrC family sensor kinase
MIEEDKSQIDILVVDDVKTSLLMLVDILLLDGYQARQASSADMALQLIAASFPDLILLDINMLGIDGFQLCRQLKSNPQTEDIPVIFISGLNDSDNIVLGFEAGAVDFISKPYSAKEVLARVNTHLVIKRMKISLKDKNEQVKKSLEQTAELQSQLFASEKMASLGRAVAGIAHELNTPMGLCVTATSYLVEKNKQVKKSFNNHSLSSKGMQDYIEAVDETLDIIMTSMQRSTEMVNNFKMVAVDVSSEKLRSFTLHDYLSRVINSLTPEIRKTRHIVEVAGDDLLIDSYPGALSQVITNIIMNAIIHGYDNGQKGHILIRTVLDGSNVHINCSDDGKGMTTESLKKVFEAYYTTRDGEGGSGLGTSIIQQLVTETLKGQVSCSSELGKGTMFTITLPVNLSA